MNSTSCLIVGAGPGGLQLGHLLQRAGRDYQIVERAPHAGAFFTTFPRHRTLISSNKVHTGFADPEKNLRWDWNSLLDDGPRFTERTGRYFPPAEEMVRYLCAFAEHHAVRVRYGAEVCRISRPDRFLVETTAGNWMADRVVVATGVWRENLPDIPGIELSESYSTMSTDPQDYLDQRVLILGKGNSAFETADNLVETTAAIHLLSPRPVRLAWKTHFVGHLRAVNNNVLDTYQLKSQNTILDANVERMVPEDGMVRSYIRYNHAQDQRIELLTHRVLRCTGFRFDTSVFDPGCMPALVNGDRHPAMTPEWESTNVPDLFFAGALMQGRDYQRTFSAFIHGFRYNVRALARFFERRYHGVPWPCRGLPASSDALLAAVMARVDRSSGLFQQPAFLADVVRVRGGAATYEEEQPVDWVVDNLDDDPAAVTLLVTMEYGHEDHPDPFNIARHPDDGTVSAFIHPVLRVYRGRELAAEHHVPEDLENDWSPARYQDPCRRFLAAHVAP